MRIRPFGTLPLRFRLKMEGRLNRLTASAGPRLDRRLREKAGRGALTPIAGGHLVLEINPYALLGHQVSSWIAGHLWARDLGLVFNSGPLSRDTHGLLNFFDPVAAKPGRKAKRVRLVWITDERDPRSLRILTAQVEAARVRYPKRELVFRLALDPARWDQTEAETVVRDALVRGYKGDEFLAKEAQKSYIALHIRRGDDIHVNHVSGKEAVDRWVLEEWYVGIVESLRAMTSAANLEIRLYALGQPEDFPLLAAAGVSLRLNGDRDTDLIDLAAAKILVLSPSSFSFTAALVSRSVVLGRVPWWHRIPSDGRWVQVDTDGNFDPERLEGAIALGD